MEMQSCPVLSLAALPLSCHQRRSSGLQLFKPRASRSWVLNYVPPTCRLTSLSSEENPSTLPLSTSWMLQGTFTATLGVDEHT